jgi:transposase
MAGRLPMGQKELLRRKVMEPVKRGNLTIRAAAKELKVSCRQGRRIYAAYVREGDRGLIHGNMGKPSGRKTAEEIRETRSMRIGSGIVILGRALRRRNRPKGKG